MKKNYIKHLIVFLIISNLLLLTYSSYTIYALSEPDIVGCNYNNGIFLNKKAYDISATIYHNPTTINFYSPDEEKDSTIDATLSLKSSNYYTGIWTPNFITLHRAAYSSVTDGYTDFPLCEIYAYNNVGFDVLSRRNMVTAFSKSFYEERDTSFYYNDPFDNSFSMPYSNSYNCASYVVGIYNKRFPYVNSLASADDFMGKTGKYSGRSGKVFKRQSSYKWADIIYYYDKDQPTTWHFAKVTSYEPDGTPAYISSKWGDLEVIISKGIDPFGSQYAPSYAYYREVN